MSVPVAVALRHAQPDSHIVWATEPRCAPLIETPNLVSEVVEFRRDEWQRRRWSPGTWFEQVNRYLGLRKVGFDIGIDLHGRAKTALCLRLANPSRRIAARAEDALARALNPLVEETGTEHVVERNLRALSKLVPIDLTPRWVMPEYEAERAAVRPKLPDTPFATFTLTSGSAGKTVPLGVWREVAKRLMSHGMGVAALGAPGDPAFEVPGAIDLVGKLSLTEALAAVKLSDVHMAADTGSGHAAGAFGVPVVSVFRSTDPGLYRPYTQRAEVLKFDPDAQVDADQIVRAALKLRGLP